MKVGYVQFEPLLGNAPQTLSRLEILLAEAEDADLMVLPELANSGYRFEDKEQALAAAEGTDGAFCSFLSKWSGRTGTAVVAGLNERAGDKLYNSSVLISDGEVKGLYRKVHLFDREKIYFEPGDLGFPVFKLGGITIAMLVCFDWIFPEAWRLVAMKGAHIVCHPSNLVLPGKAQQGVPAHSLMNRIFCITANRIGMEGPLHFTGRSIITDARGGVLHQGPADQAEVYTAEINPKDAEDKMVTPRNHLFEDRRGEFYQ